MDRFFGGNPLAVLLRLAILSVVVGIVMAALQITPFDLIDKARLIFGRVYAMGFDAFRWGLGYFVLGAVVVVPIWLIMRFLAVARGRGDKEHRS